MLVVTPGQGPDAAPVAFAGVVRAREESPLSFRVGGQIVRRLVDAGDRVRSGDVLAELDPKDLRAQADAAQAQVVAAEGELARAASDKQRYARLANDQLVSRSTLDAQNAAYAAAAGNARAARAQLDVARNQSAYTQLRAPRDGVIATREAEAGQTVGAGQAIYSLAGDAGREVAIALPESRIREFTVGQPVLVELWSQPGERLPGRIREISAAADPQARTYATRIALDSEAAKDVELGQSARVYIATSKPNAPATALRLPLSALQRGDKGETSVWVVDANTNALKRVPVRIGAFGAESVPVLSGVRAGDRVVAAGGHLLREGQVVAPVDRENRPLSKAR
ncbi:RND/Acr family transmembrane transporter [Lysobacter dokdonensis DS-58]|uniref:RND/Acr family transmembrane transporter n=1 Tax=Lysobacter dokdonensis DS-58 TaxID=1300345 RepID=A0A0A2WDI6_9GAMM|nr:RND/Acr family transmembrane transporter [Lysobacter dokdonensis DS-58]